MYIWRVDIYRGLSFSVNFHIQRLSPNMRRSSHFTHCAQMANVLDPRAYILTRLCQMSEGEFGAASTPGCDEGSEEHSDQIVTQHR